MDPTVGPRQIFNIVISLILLGLLGWLIWDYYDTKQEVARLQGVEQAATDIGNNTAAAISGLAEAQGEQQAAQITILDKRSASDQRYEELLRNDQNASDWADSPIPDSVRALDASEVKPAIDGPPDS